MSVGVRHSHKYVRKQFVKENYILLEEEYINNKQKLSFLCPKGHKYFITWSNWKSGFRCAYCAENVKYTIEFVRSEFEKEGYRLISDRYINQMQKLEYICPFNHKHNITWTDWFNGGYRCPTCRSINMCGEGNHQWKGGISYEPYCEVWKDREYKKDIKKRDGNMCLNPYCFSKIPDDLTIHHINYNKKDCRPDNLITICRACNGAANKDREWHKSWYKAIINKRYL